MRIIKIFTVIIMTFSIIPLHAQVQSVEDIEIPAPQFQDHGGVTPWFWIGLQTVFSAGYNFETTAGGFRNYGGDNFTYASFNLAFVDSHYQVPKFYEVPREIDPYAWTGHFVMLNFTTRANSWEGRTKSGGWENNAPAWLAEITGMGFRIGFFTQAASLIGGLSDPNRTDENNSKPITRITGGNKVLNLQAGQLGMLFYEKPNDPLVNTTYQTRSADGGLWYTGYEQKELWNVYLTMLSEGNVNSDVSVTDAEKENGIEFKNKGIAGVIDFQITPLGLFADYENPLTLNFSGNVIAGFNWADPNFDVARRKENVGFGLKGSSDIWLIDNLVLTPEVAFDGKVNSDLDFFYKIGGGLTFRFSGMRWTRDDWGDLYNNGYSWNTSSFSGNNNFASYRYENNRMLKFAYAQVYGATVPDPEKNGNDDFNMLIRIEEPDGNAGFHERLGLMAEARLYNMLGKELDSSKNPKALKWEIQGRVSWDVNIGKYLLIPYARGYLNDDAVLKLRVGTYANIIPFTGFEIAYTSANLNKGVELPKPSYLNRSYESFFDAGRIELIVILKSDDIMPQVPKRMSDWNYPANVQDY